MPLHPIKDGFAAYSSAAGMHPLGSGVSFKPASGAITSVDYITSTVISDSTTITCPASISSGDLLLFVDHNGLNNPTLVTPTGWTLIATTADAFDTNGLFWKIADGTESSSTITGMSNAYGGKAIIQFRANDSQAITSFSIDGVVSTITDGDPGQQTVAASGGTIPVVGIALFITEATQVDPRTTSITPDQEIVADQSVYIHIYQQTSSPADYTFDMADDGYSNSLIGCYLHTFA